MPSTDPEWVKQKTINDIQRKIEDLIEWIELDPWVLDEPSLKYLWLRLENKLQLRIKTEPCPDCEGAGKLRRNSWDATTKTHTFGMFPCYNCQGTGKVKVPTS